MGDWNQYQSKELAPCPFNEDDGKHYINPLGDDQLYCIHCGLIVELPPNLTWMHHPYSILETTFGSFAVQALGPGTVDRSASLEELFKLDVSNKKGRRDV